MPRQTLTKNYINDDEVNRQIGELADTTRVEHYEKVISEQKQQYQHLSDSYDEGKMTKEEVEQMKLMHRINRIASETSGEGSQRIQRQKEVQSEIDRVADKIHLLQRLPNSTSGEVGVKINNLYIKLMELERKL